MCIRDRGELNASIEQISYVMSASLIAEVIIIPFSGWLIRLLSTRTFFLISLSGFIFSSIGCTVSDSFLLMTCSEDCKVFLVEQ